MQILLVEDDMQLGQALASAMLGAGWAPRWVRRLAQARAFLDGPGWDAVLLDLALPDGEGLALIDQARRQGVAVPILVISARDNLQAKLQALRQGADDYVLKPFAVAELIARVQAVVRRSSGRCSPVWKVGALEIDTEQRLVRAGSQALELTGREYQLLFELARQAGRVVPKTRLLERVCR